MHEVETLSCETYWYTRLSTYSWFLTTRSLVWLQQINCIPMLTFARPFFTCGREWVKVVGRKGSSLIDYLDTVHMYIIRSRLDRSVELLYKRLNSVPVG